MKIDAGRGTPIWIYPRDNGSVLLMQGSSHINLSSQEIELLIRALVHEPL
jgi:hypothetical protein